MSALKIWVDTDVALGAARGDVDDGFALAAVIRASQRPGGPQLLGISAVAGNTDADTALACTRSLLQRAGAASVPAVPAAHAAAAIAALPAGTRLLALGPLTNVAAALRKNPLLARNTALWCVATVHDRRRHPLLPWFCLNFRHDPAAAREVLAAPLAALRICPLDVVQRLRFGRDELAAVAATGALGEYLAEASQRWLRQSGWRYLSSRFPVWDLVAALDALGELPGAVYTERQLITFDVAAARQQLLGLLRDPGNVSA